MNTEPVEPTIKRVKITHVDLGSLRVEGVDSMAGLYFIDCAFQPGIVTIPVVGDDWIICKVADRWILDYRLERPSDDDPIQSLTPGDVRINSGSKLLINSKSIYMNGVRSDIDSFPIKGEVPIGLIDGVNTEFYLLYPRVEGSLEVFVNGLKTTAFTDTGGFLIFDEPPLEDSSIVVNYRTRSTNMEIGTPQHIEPGPGG